MKIFYRILSCTIWIAASLLLLLWPKLQLVQGKNDKNLYIFSWSDVFDTNTIESFEKKYNAKVHILTYNSNEEMLTKVKATKGKGYNLIVPSDYAVPLLKKEGLIKELDYSRLNFVDRLNPKLLGHEFDNQNRYSLPLQWAVFGFGIDREVFPNKRFTYDHIFNSNKRIVMVNDPIEAINFAAFYLYGPIKSLTQAQVEEVKELLLTQKESVEAYVDMRADYLLATHNCDLAIAQHYYLWRTGKDAPHVDFVLPEGEIFVSIESIVIPQTNQKDSLTYAFINHIYEKENIINQCHAWYSLPPTEDVIENLDFADRYQQLEKELEKRPGKKFHFFRHLIPEEESRKLWIEIKS